MVQQEASFAEACATQRAHSGHVIDAVKVGGMTLYDTPSRVWPAEAAPRPARALYRSPLPCHRRRPRSLRLSWIALRWRGAGSKRAPQLVDTGQQRARTLASSLASSNTLALRLAAKCSRAEQPFAPAALSSNRHRRPTRSFPHYPAQPPAASPAASAPPPSNSRPRNHRTTPRCGV